MKNTMTLVQKLAVAGILTGIASSASALNVTYDFGTDPGKSTLGDAGFTSIATGAAWVDDVADGVLIERLDPGAGGFENAGFVRAFSGLGGGATTDFSLSTTFTITAWDVANVNNDRFGGIQLFADTADSAGIESTGLTATLLGDSGADNDDFVIRNGLNGSTLVSGELGYDFALNDVFLLQVDGTFSGTTLNLDFHVSRNGGTTQTISATRDTVTNAADLDGAFFGVATRLKDTTGSEFDTFSVSAIPEPSVLACLATALGLIAVFRRRN